MYRSEEGSISAKNTQWSSPSDQILGHDSEQNQTTRHECWSGERFGYDRVLDASKTKSPPWIGRRFCLTYLLVDLRVRKTEPSTTRSSWPTEAQ
jgi:hypothetical protein